MPKDCPRYTKFMELTRYLRFIKRNLPLIVVTALVVTVVSVGATLSQPVRYQSSSALLLTLKDTRNITDYDFDQYYLLQAADLYAGTIVAWLNSPDVNQNVRTQAGAADGKIRGRKSGGTIELKATADTQQKANALVASATKLISDRSQSFATGSNRSNFGVQPADLGSKPVKPSPGTSAAAGLVAGLLLGLVLALLREGTTRRIRGWDDVAKMFASVVPARRSDAPSLEGHQLGPYRVLRELLEAPSGLVIVGDFTGGSGRTAVGLGAAVARTGTTTLIVDADPNGRQVPQLLGVSGAKGLSEVMHGSKPANLVESTSLEHLMVLPAGSPAAYLDDHLSGRQVKKLAAEVGKLAEVVIVNIGPNQPALLAWRRVADELVFAVEQDRTRLSELSFIRRNAGAKDAKAIYYV